MAARLPPSAAAAPSKTKSPADRADRRTVFGSEIFRMMAF